MKKKLTDFIYYFTPRNDDEKAIAYTPIVFVLFWLGIYLTAYLTNL